ncbi:MAG: hypothetical protein HYU37_12645 [Acidobacteria bacterium]|nr:hypothetical protein [Acidobacteriota bacterium]
MKLDTARLRHFAPFALPLLIVVFGWLLLVRPTMASGAESARQLQALEQRLAAVRRSLTGPRPATVSGDARAAFERQVAARDASAQVFERLATLAKQAGVTNLTIETGQRTAVTVGTGPQAASAVPDPRIALFEVPLAFLPITMAFDGPYAAAGQFLWQLRDPPTVVEIRTLEMRSTETGDGRVHMTLTLFAFARQPGDVVPAGGRR